MFIELVMPSYIYNYIYIVHVRWIGDAFQASYPLLSPSPFALNLSQHQGFFQWVSSSHQVAKVLEFQLQHQSFQWIFRVDWLVWLWQGLIRVDLLVWSSCCPRDYQDCSPAPQFESINSSVLSFLYGPTLSSIRDYWKTLTTRTFVDKVMSLLFNMLSSWS